MKFNKITQKLKVGTGVRKCKLCTYWVARNYDKTDGGTYPWCLFYDWYQQGKRSGCTHFSRRRK